MWMMIVGAALAAGPRYDLLENGADWKSVAVRHSDQGDVTVSTKTIDGLPCLQGVAVVPVSADKLLAVARDIPSSRRWSSATLLVSENLKSLPDGGIQYWQYLDIPGWTMVYDRYWVMEGHATTVAGVRRFRWDRVAAASYPAVLAKAASIEAGSVEPPVNWGEWVFAPKGDATEVSYRACVDVGGKLPMSIQQWAATRTLPDTVADLVRETKKRG